MARKPYAFIRANRRKWGLTQVELARLLGFATRTAVSRIERAERTPATETIIACRIIFGLDVPDLFPSLHDEIEHSVLLATEELLQAVAESDDSISIRKRQLLEDILERIISAKRNTNL